MPEDLRQAPALKSRIADGGFLSRYRLLASSPANTSSPIRTGYGAAVFWSLRIDRRTHQAGKQFFPADAVAILLNGDNVRRGPVSTVASEPVVVGRLGGAAVDGGAVIVETVV